MITVGLTGNAGSGKTTVADRWRERGVRVIDADMLGHDVLREDEAARAALVEAFGPGILDADGEVDRRVLGERALASPEATERLNAIVHPPLLARLDRELAAAREASRELAAVDAALVFEFGLDEKLDRVVLVTAPRAQRVERLLRKGLDLGRIERIMARQAADAEKAPKSEFVIVNDGSIEDLRARADEVLDAIMAETTDGEGSDG